MENALDEYTEQLNVCEALSDNKSLAVAHRMIGEIHTNLGDYNEALNHLNQYLAGAKQTQDLLEQQRAFATIGRTYFCLGESLEESEKKTNSLFAAKKAYGKSLKICQKLETTDVQEIEIMTMRARLLLNLGLVLEAQKQPVQAVELIERAAELCEIHKLNQDLHRIHVALGGLYERQEKYEEALKHYNQSAKITVDELNIANARVSEAELLAKLGRWTEARKILVDLYVNYNNPSLTTTITKLLKNVAAIDKYQRVLDKEQDNARRMLAYEMMGDATVAVSCYNKAIECYHGMLACAESNPAIYHDKISAALVSLAQTLKDAKRYNEALIFARQELELCANDNRERCRSALFLADLLTCIKDTSDTEICETYQMALTSATESANITLERTVLREMKEYFIEIGDFKQVDEIKEKICTLEKMLILDDESSNESNESTGIDIDLDDLSDVEREFEKKNDKTKNPRTRRPAKQGLVVKRNQKGETKLHTACINNSIDEVKTLLAAGHPVNVRDNLGWTPLHESANFGHLEIAKMLIKAGANINDPGGPACGNITPLHDAATCGHCAMVNLLIEHGADIRVKTKSGDTVLTCLEAWRNRIEKEREQGELQWTADDEKIYKSTRNKLRMILPTTINKITTPIDLHKAPLIDADDTSQRAVVISDDEDRERISAGEDYKRTIERLKNRGRVTGTAKINKMPTVNNVAPLVDNEEQLIDDWLEDDMESMALTNNIKKKNDDDLSTAKRKTFRSSTSNTTPENERISKRPRRSDDTEIFSSVVRRENHDINSDTDDFRDPTIRSHNLRQTSLLQMSGFTKDLTTRTPSPTISYTDDFVNKQKTTTRVDAAQFKITIGDRIINIKLKYTDDNDYLMRCLINEVVDKFQQDTGCKLSPIFTTTNGDNVQADNLLNLIYTNKDECIKFFGHIIDLEIPIITERYKTICAALNIGM